MKLIKPRFELLSNPITMDERYAHMAKCARVCTKNNKTTDNERFVHSLIDSSHISMLRHDSVYYIVKNSTIKSIMNKFDACPYVFMNIDDKGNLYISTNSNFTYDHGEIADILMPYEVDALTFSNTPIGFSLMRYTFIVTTQISTTRELNRVSPNNISEESTRYVNYSRDKFGKDCTLCCPHWINIDEDLELAFINTPVFEDTIGCDDKYALGFRKLNSEENFKHDVFYSSEYSKEQVGIYLRSCDRAFNSYLNLTNHNIIAQDARGVLPLDTATTAVYTYSIPEWKHIINLRYYGTTGAPHPNAKIIARMIRDRLLEEGYEL